MTAKTLFGTDGVRGRANVDLTPEMALHLARAAATGLSGVALVGRDTRRSGQMLAAAVHAGFRSAGVDTLDTGILPVGGVSFLAAERRAAIAAMVSASHNPAEDNGIKFLGRDGAKLDDDQEATIEARYWEMAAGPAISGADVGIGGDIADAVDLYVEHLAGKADFSLNGLDIALDCAQGAAFAAAPQLFEQLGADVTVFAVEPSGMNINDGCGATHPEFLADRSDGRIGLAFDGDADRLIAVDEDGFSCNGDVIMAILARHLRSRDRLPGDVVVTTVMSNLGFRIALQKMGVKLVETRVGDRYVLEEMRRTGAGLGGEQSGHVIFENRPAGDGLLTAIRLLEVVAATGAPLKELRRVMVPYPQVLRNVAVRVKERLPDADAVWAAVEKLEKRLGDDGRILVRASGTEPLVRVMVEASTAPEAAAIADELAIIVRRELGAVENEN
jgi:phosphoglucosamine mutase